MFDGGVLINVLGRLKVRFDKNPFENEVKECLLLLCVRSQTDDDQPHGYTQTFVLKPIGNSFFVQHDIFRLALHDLA